MRTKTEIKKKLESMRRSAKRKDYDVSTSTYGYYSNGGYMSALEWVLGEKVQ